MKTFFVAVAILCGTVSAAFAEGGSVQASSHDLGGAIGQSVGNGSAVVGVSVALPLLSAGGVGASIAQTAIRQYDPKFYTPGKPLPIAKEVIVPPTTPDAALAKQSEEK